MSEEASTSAGVQTWMPRHHVRSFYSGHSLSEGVPEIVDSISRSLDRIFEFEVQVQGYSLLRQRTKGEVPEASDWPGYRAGQNRSGYGLDVAQELRVPQRLAPGSKYDVLVVTERHDLPAIARKERTAFFLVEMTKHLLAGNPHAEVLLYHTWRNLDPDAPWPWIAYEKAVAPMWECVASRANRDLPRRGNVPRVRVIPGGSALAELVSELWQDRVPGIAASPPGARVRQLFSDNVHLTDVGRYYIALLHYSILFGHSPEGAAIPAQIAPELGAYLQTHAARYAAAYGRRADQSAQRSMDACRKLIVDEICPAVAAFHQGSRIPGLAAFRSWTAARACRRDYGDQRDPENPFADQ